MSETVLLDLAETLTPANHQTHRRYRFDVPERCRRILIDIRYTPKFLSPAESAPLVAATLEAQRRGLAAAVDEVQAQEWAKEHSRAADHVSVANLLTISLDDADGAYRGAGHRHDNHQRLIVATTEASPGLVAGPLPPGTWTLTLSAHTVASLQCAVSIQIGAETASSAP